MVETFGSFVAQIAEVSAGSGGETAVDYNAPACQRFDFAASWSLNKRKDSTRESSTVMWERISAAHF